MAESPILFTFGSPLPSAPRPRGRPGAAVVATAHSTYPNQMDITAVVPGVFRGLLDVRASSFPITPRLLPPKPSPTASNPTKLHADYIYPKVIDYRVAPAVAQPCPGDHRAEGQRQTPGREPAADRRTHPRFVYEGQLPVPPKSEQPMSVAEESLELHDRFQGLAGNLQQNSGEG
jgi:malic enzyme